VCGLYIDDPQWKSDGYINAAEKKNTFGKKTTKGRWEKNGKGSKYSILIDHNSQQSQQGAYMDIIIIPLSHIQQNHWKFASE